MLIPKPDGLVFRVYARSQSRSKYHCYTNCKLKCDVNIEVSMHLPLGVEQGGFIVFIS
jgi:hypothetical protein